MAGKSPLKSGEFYGKLMKIDEFCLGNVWRYVMI